MAKRVYLAGPIANCDDEECADWRNWATGVFHANGVEVENPMDRDMRGVKNFDIRALVEGDKAAIDRCSHILVHWSRIGAGSAMELIYGWERKKKIVIVNAAWGPLSPWLRYHSHRVVDDLDEGIRFVLNDSVELSILHPAT